MGNRGRRHRHADGTVHRHYYPAADGRPAADGSAQHRHQLRRDTGWVVAVDSPRKKDD